MDTKNKFVQLGFSETGDVRSTFNSNCGFCGLKISDISSDEYLNYIQRLIKKGCSVTSYRCPSCEIDFVETVFSLDKKAIQTLEKKWLKHGITRIVNDNSITIKGLS